MVGTRKTLIKGGDFVTSGDLSLMALQFIIYQVHIYLPGFLVGIDSIKSASVYKLILSHHTNTPVAFILNFVDHTKYHHLSITIKYPS